MEEQKKARTRKGSERLEKHR